MEKRGDKQEADEQRNAVTIGMGCRDIVRPGECDKDAGSSKTQRNQLDGQFDGKDQQIHHAEQRDQNGEEGSNQAHAGNDHAGGVASEMDGTPCGRQHFNQLATVQFGRRQDVLTKTLPESFHARLTQKTGFWRG